MKVLKGVVVWVPHSYATKVRRTQRAQRRGAPEPRRNPNYRDNCKWGREVHIATRFRKESERWILASQGGGWGIGHTIAVRFAGSCPVHSLQ